MSSFTLSNLLSPILGVLTNIFIILDTVSSSLISGFIISIDIFDSFSFLIKSSIAILNSFDLSVISPDCTRNKIKR